MRSIPRPQRQDGPAMAAAHARAGWPSTRKPCDDKATRTRRRGGQCTRPGSPVRKWSPNRSDLKTRPTPRVRCGGGAVGRVAGLANPGPPLSPPAGRGFDRAPVPPDGWPGG